MRGCLDEAMTPDAELGPRLLRGPQIQTPAGRASLSLSRQDFDYYTPLQKKLIEADRPSLAPSQTSMLYKALSLLPTVNTSSKQPVLGICLPPLTSVCEFMKNVLR